jgi:hypothetical protein
MSQTLAVIAKAPVPGRVKTRLTPPLTPAEAAALAEASLRDTLAAMGATRVARRVVVLDGAPGAWLPPGVDVVAQRGGGLDERLAAAFEDLGPDTLIVGMDTPQLSAPVLERALDALRGADAVLGPAQDGGYWGIGLRRPDPRALLGVPMSVAHTGEHQRRRLASLGLDVVELPVLRDVDDVRDVRAVARLAPGTGFALRAAAIAAV